MKLQAKVPYLDEAGCVYLPLVGPGGACLRLNAAGSAAWRRWMRTSVDRERLHAAEGRLLDDLIARGALVSQ